MFHQLVTPVVGSLPASFAVAAVPIVVVSALLGVIVMLQQDVFSGVIAY